jgi:CBS domain-containing protein
VGILTDRDLAMRVVAEVKDPNTTMVALVMTREPECVNENAPVEGAISTMRAASCRRLPVVDDQERLVGLVTLDDIIGLLSEEFREIGTLLWNENLNSLSPT